MNTEFDTASVGYPVTRFGVSFFPVYLAANELPEISTEGLIIDELDSERVSETVSTQSYRKADTAYGGRTPGRRQAEPCCQLNGSGSSLK